MSLTLSETTTARIAEAAAQRGMDAEEMLLDLLDAEEAEYTAACAAMTEGFAEFDAGLGRSLEEYAAEQRARWEAQRNPVLSSPSGMPTRWTRLSWP